jgi:tetratricopeptide (TPR) repeat protein
VYFRKYILPLHTFIFLFEQMAKKARNTPTVDTAPYSDGTESLRDVQKNFEKNQKVIFGIVIAVVVLVAGVVGYQQFIQKPNEEKAATAIFHTQKWFESDTAMNLVLNGDGQNGGALSVIKKYGGTPSGNLARYYAGVAYLKLGQPEEAVKHLEKFDGEGTVFQYLAYGAIGSAYLDMNNPAKAIEYYKKAVSGNEKDNFTNPYFLKMAGQASELNGKTEDAIKFYQEIKTKYPLSMEARDIDKYLARLGTLTTD